MESAENTGDSKRESDDSGCVPDDATQNTIGQANLLDFSDDVLLCIFRHCLAPDLKSLAHSCVRLGRLVRERSLWRHVDASPVPCSRARLRWYLENVLHSDTRSLKINGYAKDAKGCVGFINIPRKESLEPSKNCFQAVDGLSNEITICGGFQEIPTEIIEREPPQGERNNARYFISAQRPQLPRHRCCMSWPDDDLGRQGPHPCRGPQFSISPELFRQLGARCPHITALSLDYCNIDSHSTGLALFPKSLKKLSLRGSKCYNVTFDKSFVYKIQDHLPHLLSLDVSECEWMEPAGLLPLSKMTALEELIIQDCHKLSEFVAYASLTARYGFKSLKSLDLRGSPVGDSEVSALGWLPKLEKLWLSARGVQRARPHAHYADDERSEHVQLDPWEITGLEYTPILNPETSTENIGSEADASFDESSSPNKKDKVAKDDRHKKDAKRKPKDRSDSNKTNGEPSRKRRKGDGKKDDKHNKGSPGAYSAYGVISINGLRRALGIDNEQAQSNDEGRRDAAVANEAIPELDAIRVSVANNEVCINMNPPEDGNDRKDKTDNKKVENDESPKNDEENADKSKEKPGNDKKDDKNHQDNSRQLSETLPLVHPSAECVIDCIKIDQMHDAKAKRGRSNEVILIASSSRKHRLPRNFPDYDRVHIKRNRDPVLVEIRQRVQNQNGDNERPGPSNAAAANIGRNEPEKPGDAAKSDDLEKPLAPSTNGSDNNQPRRNKMRFQDFLLPPEEFQLKLQEFERTGPFDLGPLLELAEQYERQDAAQSQQVKVVENDQKPEQAQSQNQRTQENTQSQEHEQKLENMQRPEQESDQIEEQKQRPERKTRKPEQIEELNQKPGQMEELKRKPEQTEEQNEKPEQIEELTQKPEQMEELKQKPVQMEVLEQKPEQMEEQNQKPVKLEEQNKKPAQLEELEQNPEQMEDKNQKPRQMEVLEEMPEHTEEVKQKPEQIKELKQKPEQMEEHKQEPEKMEEHKQKLEHKPKPEKRDKQKQKPDKVKEQKQKADKKEKQKKKPENIQGDGVEGLQARPEQGQGNEPRPQPIQYQVEPRHHVLYVGVGPQLNTYRFPRDASELIRHVNYGPTHVDSRSLVTDFALRRFGRAEGDVNIIHLDPNGPVPVGQSSGSRPDRSNLRLLSVNGYRNVTDRSLVHLATAAPHLEFVDFSGTNISANGVEVFKCLNPDCVFVHSPFDEME